MIEQQRTPVDIKCQQISWTAHCNNYSSHLCWHITAQCRAKSSTAPVQTTKTRTTGNEKCTKNL